MGLGAGKVTRLLRELLRRVAAAGVGDRFAFRDVCPLDANRYAVALEIAIDCGFIARVTDGRCGKWFLRLTDAGKEAARSGKVNGPAAIPATFGEREAIRRGEFGVVDGHTKRQRRKAQ
jgi:hypothetical protein